MDEKVSHLGRAVGYGLLLNLLAALVLASFGRWSPRADAISVVVLIFVGIGYAKRRGVLTLRWLWNGLTATLLVGAVTALVVLAPSRSEWLAGGWDPGIYQNNAVVIATHDGFQARADSAYAFMEREERALLVRSAANYHEVFPGVPLSLDTGKLVLYVLHLTSLAGAFFYRMGGEAFLFRMPTLLGIWCLFPALALMIGLGVKGHKRWLGLLPWCLSAFWWYHMAIPTSEMLYLFLILTGMVAYFSAVQHTARVPVPAVLVLFAATINHLNAVVLLSFALLLAVVIEKGAGIKRCEWRIVACFSAIAAALIWSFIFSDITIGRLDEKDDILAVILPVAGGCLLLALGVARFGLPGWLIRYGPRWVGIAGMLGAVVVGAVALSGLTEWTHIKATKLFSLLPWLNVVFLRLMRLSLFQGVWMSVWVAAGLLLLAWPRSSLPMRMKVSTAILGAIVVLLLVSPGIAPLYPWALRRYIVFLIPFCVLAQAAALWVLFERRPRAWDALRWGLATLLIVACLNGLQQSRAAASVGDYRGVYEALSEVDNHLEENDVVVADDPRWGTPLMLYFDRDVINGRLMWRSDDEAYHRRVLAILRRIASEQNRRVVWMTSLPSGTAIYPFAVGETERIMDDRPVTYPTVIHSERGNHFAEQENERLFGLHAWKAPVDEAL